MATTHSSGSGRTMQEQMFFDSHGSGRTIQEQMFFDSLMEAKIALRHLVENGYVIQLTKFLEVEGSVTSITRLLNSLTVNLDNNPIKRTPEQLRRLNVMPGESK